MTTPPAPHPDRTSAIDAMCRAGRDLEDAMRRGAKQDEIEVLFAIMEKASSKAGVPINAGTA